MLHEQIGYTEELVQAWEDLITGAVERYNPQVKGEKAQEAKKETKNEVKAETKTETKAEVKTEAKETKTQEVKAETKEAVREERSPKEQILELLVKGDLSEADAERIVSSDSLSRAFERVVGFKIVKGRTAFAKPETRAQLIEQMNQAIRALNAFEEDIRQSSVQTEGNTLRGSSRQYRFVEQIDNRESMNPNETFVVGATPDIWQRIGMANLPVVIDQSHIEAAIDGTRDIDHHLGLDMVKQLPQAIKKPIAIIRSDTRPGDSVVVILKLEHTLPSGERKQVITPVNVNGIGNSNNVEFDANSISSFFGKGNILQKLSDAISDEISGKPSVYWINKKEAYYVMNRNRVQFPNSDLRTGFIHSIQETSTSVNQNLSSVQESRQFKRWFGKSKIVDNAGKPLVVYHGSKNKEIRTFITNNSMGTGGLYLTTDQSVAESFAKDGKVYPAYARVERPLIIDADYRMYDSIPADRVPKNLRKKFPSWSTFDTNAIVAWARENGNYDGVWIKNVRENGLYVYADDIVVFDENQVKSTYNVGTYNDDGNIYYSYQTEKPLSNRDILEMAAGQIEVEGLTDKQKQALQNFKDKLEKQRGLEEQRSQLQQIRDIERANGKDVKKTNGRITEIGRRIRVLENEIATAEDSELYKNILKKARATVERIQRAEFDKRLAKYRMGVKENQAQSKYRGRVMEQATALMDILTKPDTKDIRKRIPVELQTPILQFLQSIDFSSKRLLAGGEETQRDARFKQKLIDAVAAVKQSVDTVNRSGYSDIRPEFLEELDAIVEKVRDKNLTLNEMSGEGGFRAASKKKRIYNGCAIKYNPLIGQIRKKNGVLQCTIQQTGFPNYSAHWYLTKAPWRNMCRPPPCRFGGTVLKRSSHCRSLPQTTSLRR